MLVYELFARKYYWPILKYKFEGFWFLPHLSDLMQVLSVVAIRINNILFIIQTILDFYTIQSTYSDFYKFIFGESKCNSLW